MGEKPSDFDREAFKRAVESSGFEEETLAALDALHAEGAAHTEPAIFTIDSPRKTRVPVEHVRPEASCVKFSESLEDLGVQIPPEAFNPPRVISENVNGIALAAAAVYAAEHEDVRTGDEVLAIREKEVLSHNAFVKSVEGGRAVIRYDGTNDRIVPIGAARVLKWLGRDVFRAGIFLPGVRK